MMWKQMHSGSTGSLEDKGIICFIDKMREKSLKPTGFTLECESRRHKSKAAGEAGAYRMLYCLHNVVILGNILNDAAQASILHSSVRVSRDSQQIRFLNYCCIHTVCCTV